jgi:hypothetical protein
MVDVVANWGLYSRGVAIWFLLVTSHSLLVTAAGGRFCPPVTSYSLLATAAAPRYFSPLTWAQMVSMM